MAGLVKAPSIPTGQDFRIVKNNGTLDEDVPLLFTFSDFKMAPISIEDFNNFYSNQEEYLRKLSVFIGKALPLLSNEKMSIFSDRAKMNSLHLHPVHGKDDILRKIFEKYQFNSKAIDNILEGASIYQFEVPYENGASRVVFQRIDNLVSFLFLDPNHHIYLNRKFVDENGSLFYEFCPVNECEQCERMNYLKTCFAFDYLDEERYKATYEYSYSYDDKE